MAAWLRAVLWVIGTPSVAVIVFQGYMGLEHDGCGDCNLEAVGAMAFAGFAVAGWLLVACTVELCLLWRRRRRRLAE